MEVAGVNKITLYENKGVVLTQTIVDHQVVEISNTGTVDTFDFCVDVDFESDVENGNNYTQLKKDVVTFYIQNFNKETRALVKRLQDSLCGYLVKVEFESGLKIITQDSLFAEETKKDFNKNSFLISLAYRVQSEKNYLELFPENSILLISDGSGEIGITTINTKTQKVYYSDGYSSTLVDSVKNTHTPVAGRNIEIRLDEWESTTALGIGNSHLIGSLIQLNNVISHLFLNNNNLTGGIENLENKSSLKNIQLYRNNLQGHINYIDSLVNLEDVNLSYNSFSGDISNFNSLIRLHSLIISNNLFTGAQLDAFIVNEWDIRAIRGAKACNIQIENNASGISADSVERIEGTGIYIGEGLKDYGCTVTYTAA